MMASLNSSTLRTRERPAARSGVDWSIAGPLFLAHILALAAPFTWTPAGLVSFGVLYLLSGLGVTAGAHRCFTHTSFRARPGFRRLLHLLFLLSAQGSLLRWVRDHHIHHAFSDQEGDPHTPHQAHGFWYAQLTWLWKKPGREENRRLYEKYGGGLYQDRFIRSFSRGDVLVGFHLGVMALVYACGAVLEQGWAWDSLYTGWFTGLSCLVWGVFLRVVCVLHATSLVNSASHLWGYRNYETREESRNNAWVALVSLGEGWHNNHHSRPVAANQGFHRWWEFDLTFCCLLLAGALGLLHDLRVYRGGRSEIWFPSSPA